MGIKGLAKFLADNAPRSVKQQEIGAFTGHVLAVDASMSLYQFMIAIREGDAYQTLVNEAGEATSHISGMLSRVIRLMENGIKPVYVFDGKPPLLKSGELALRKDRRNQAEAGLAEATEAGDKEAMKKFTSRTVKVTVKHNEDVKRLLRLMGVPVVEAPCEAEAQCAVLCAAEKVYAVATEDADALTFGSCILVRNLNFSNDTKGKGNPILTFHLNVALEDLKLSMDQFIDFCILCGCDYTETIRGIGPHTAYNLVREHGCIEKILTSIDRTKHPIPEVFPFQEARSFFKQPEVADPSSVNLKWTTPDYAELKRFLVEENSFSEQRVENSLTRLKNSQGRKGQTRLETFFGVPTSVSSSKPPPSVVKPKAKARGRTATTTAAQRGKRRVNGSRVGEEVHRGEGQGEAASKLQHETDKGHMCSSPSTADSVKRVKNRDRVDEEELDI